MAYLLDTNVVSEIQRPTPDRRVARWIESVRSHDLYLSVLVLGEVRRGIEDLRPRDPDRAAGYEKWLETLEQTYSDHIIPVSAAVADRWGRLNGRRKWPVIDSLLAATALVHDFTFVTRNGKDVKGTGVRLLDPFAAA